MNKIFHISAVFVIVGMFTLSAQPFERELREQRMKNIQRPDSPAEAVREPSTQRYCYAIQNQFTMELIRQVVVDNTMKMQTQEFQPILLGTVPGGEVILVGKAPDSDQIERIPIRFIKDSTVLETKNFLVTQQEKDRAAGFVTEVICKP